MSSESVNANRIVYDFFNNKENQLVLNKAIENGFWEKLENEGLKSKVIDYSKVDKKDVAFLKITIPRDSKWMLIRARPLTDNPEEYGYELLLQEDSENALKSVDLFGEPIFTHYAVVIVKGEVRQTQVINCVSINLLPFLEKVKTEFGKV